MGKYKPWMGFSLFGAAVVLDFLCGRTGIPTLVSLIVVTLWTRA